MLHNETPSEWKKPCLLYKTKANKDTYGYVKSKSEEEPTEVQLCIQPVTDESIIKEFGLERKSGIETVVYDSTVEIEPLFILECEGVRYRVKGVKPFISYRLVIAERI